MKNKEVEQQKSTGGNVWIAPTDKGFVVEELRKEEEKDKDEGEEEELGEDMTNLSEFKENTVP